MAAANSNGSLLVSVFMLECAMAGPETFSGNSGGFAAFPVLWSSWQPFILPGASSQPKESQYDSTRDVCHLETCSPRQAGKCACAKLFSLCKQELSDCLASARPRSSRSSQKPTWTPPRAA